MKEIKNIARKIWWLKTKKTIKDSLMGWLMLFLLSPILAFLAGVLVAIVVYVFKFGYNLI